MNLVVNLMKISAKDWQAYVNKLSSINKKAGELLSQYIDQHGFYDREALIDYANAVVSKYGEASATLACQLYDELAEIQKANVPLAEPATIANRNEVAGAIVKTRGKKQATMAVERLVKLSASDTILKNAKRDHAEWAWVSRGDTCAFCMRLASLGWMPASKAIMRGNHAEHIHAHCDCEFAIRFDGKSSVEGYDPEKYLKMYEDAKGTKPIDKINAMRRAQYPSTAEARNARRRELYAINALNSSFDEAKLNLSEHIHNKDIAVELNPEMMTKHLENTWDGKSSYFIGDLDKVQKLIDQNAGTGVVLEKQSGKQYKEIIEVNHDIGYNIDENTGTKEKTNRYVTHYSKNRTHAVPAKKKGGSNEFK